MNTPSGKSASTVVSWLEGKFVYSIGFGVALMVATGAGLFYVQRAREHAVATVRIAYGAGGPVRKHFLEQMVLHGRTNRLDIRLVVTEGTQATIELVEKGEADLGLIAGAIEDVRGVGLLEVAPLYMEPLQLLVKESLYDAVSKDFGALRGRSVGVDAQRSATNLLATELMRFMGLVDGAGRAGYQPVYLQQAELIALTDSAALPDAVFQLGGLPSQTIRHLVTAHHYRMLPLPFGPSFSLDRFREADGAAVEGTTLRLNRTFIEEFTIPAFAYSVLPPVPPDDTRTMATRLMLVGSDRVGATAVRRVVDLVMSPEISALATPHLSPALLESAFQFPRHPGTLQYMDALKPIDVDNAFVVYGRAVEVWGIIVAVYVGASSGLKAWRQRRQSANRSVGDFMQAVLAVEAEATADCTSERRAQLDQQLTDIKKAAIDLQQEELLEDAEQLPSLLVIVADTRTRIWGRAS